MPNLSGTTLTHYRVEALISAGETGEVYRATDLNLKRQVALKVLRTAGKDRDEDREFGQHFLRVARATSGLSHPNIVPIYDVETGVNSEDAANAHTELCFVTMPFLERGSLRSVLQRRTNNQLPIPLAQSLAWMRQVADGLDYAHAKGLVHGAIKPENLLLDDGSEAGRASGTGYNGAMTNAPVIRIADFGLAGLSASSGQTRTDIAPGNMAYVSPEQSLGQPNIDRSSDLYSLGVVMYELVTGLLPYSVRTMSDVIALSQMPVPSPRLAKSDLPDEVEAIIVRCLEKTPTARFASASALSQALSTALLNLPSASPTPSRAAEPDLPTRVINPLPKSIALPRQIELTLMLDNSTPMQPIQTLSLTPGRTSSCFLQIANLSNQLDIFTITVEGVPEHWWSEAVFKREITLSAQARTPLPLTILVPCEPESLAGNYKVLIRARARGTGTVESLQTTWIVLPCADCDITVEPANTSGRRRATYQLQVRNSGNTPGRFVLSASPLNTRDENGPTAVYDFTYNQKPFDASTSALQLEPGTPRELQLTVKPEQQRWMGSAQIHRFAVQVALRDGSVQKTREAEFKALPLLPWWLPLLLLALIGGTYSLSRWLLPHTNPVAASLAPTQQVTALALATALPTLATLPTAPLTAAPLPATFAGVWHTNFATLVMTPNAVGLGVNGVYTFYGSTVQELRLKGDFNPDRGQLIGSVEGVVPFTFTLAADGNSFDGVFLYSDNMPKQWCGARSGSLPAGCGFSGQWHVSSPSQPGRTRIMMEQTGEIVTGLFSDGSTITGTLTTTPDYEFSAMDATSKLTWKLDLTSQYFQGQIEDAAGQTYDSCGWRDGVNPPSPCGVARGVAP